MVSFEDYKKGKKGYSFEDYKKEQLSQAVTYGNSPFKTDFKPSIMPQPYKANIIPFETTITPLKTFNEYQADFAKPEITQPTIEIPKTSQAQARPPYVPLSAIRPSVILPSVGAGLSNLATGLNKALLTAGEIALAPPTLLNQKLSGQKLDVSQNTLLNIPKFAQSKLEQDQSYIQSKIPTNLNTPERVLSGVLQSAPTMAASALTGGTAGLGVLGATSFGQGVSTAEQSGANYPQKLGYGALSAGTEIATEYLPLKGLQKIITGKTGNVIKQIASNMGTEFIGESTSQLADTINRKVTFDPTARMNLQQILESGATGATSALLLGGSMAGVNSAITAIQNKDTSPETMAQVNNDVEKATGVNIMQELDSQPNEGTLSDVKTSVDTNVQPMQESSPIGPLETKNSIPVSEITKQQQSASNYSIENLNTEPDLTKAIADIENQIAIEKDPLLKINLQLFAKNLTEKLNAIRKQSKTAQTLTGSSLTQPMAEETAKNIEAGLFDYDAITNKDTLKEAQDIINNDKDSAINESLNLSKFRNATDVAIFQDLIRQSVNERNLDLYNKLSVKYAELGTNSGQQVQAMSMLKKMTPEGALQFVNSQANKINNEQLEGTNLGKKIEKETSKISDSLNKADLETTKEIIDYAKKEISKSIKKPSTDKKDIVDSEKTITLKPETPSGPKPIPLKRNITLNTMIKESISDLDLQMDKVVRNMFEMGRPSREAIKADIIQKLGVEGAEAERISTQIENKLKELTKSKREAILKVYFPEAKQPLLQKSAETKVHEIANLGAFVNQNYVDKVNARLEPIVRQYLKDNNIDLNKLVRLGAESVYGAKYKLITDMMLNTNTKYYSEIIDATSKAFDQLESSKKKSILDQMLKEKKTYVKKSGNERLIELINLGAFDNQAIADVVKQKYGIEGLTKQEQAFIISKMEESKLAKTEREKEVLIAQAMKVVNDKVPASLTEKYATLQRISMLLNPTTQIRNIAGNTAIGGFEVLKEIPRVPIDALTSFITKEKTSNLYKPSDFKAGLSGAKKGLAYAWNDYSKGINTRTDNGQFEIGVSKVFNDTSGNIIKRKVNKALNQANELTSFLLSAGDRPFFEFHKSLEESRLSRLPQNNKQLSTAEATRIAEERTFQNKSAIANSVMGARRHFGIPGRVVLPFAFTPSNIIDKIFDYTPLGISRTIGKNVLYDNFSKNGMFDQAQFTERAARNLTGTALIALGYALAQAGIISGAYSEDKDQKEFQKSSGIADYAFNVGDKQYSFDWLQPASIPFSIGANLYNKGLSETEMKEKIYNNGMKSIIESANTIFEQPLLTGLQKIFGGYGQGSILENVTGLAKEAPAQIIPGLSMLRKARQVSDPYQRQIDYNDPTQSLINQIPGLSKMLPIKYSTLGQPVKYGDTPTERFINAFVNPGQIGDKNLTKEEQFIINSYEKTQDKNIFPRIAPKKATYDKKEYSLNQDDISNWNKNSGEYIKNQLSEILKSSAIDKLSNEELSSVLSNLSSDGFEYAKNQFLINKGINVSN